jgi:hypothetical protein
LRSPGPDHRVARCHATPDSRRRRRCR